MVRIDILKNIIKESGMTMIAISRKSGILRPTLYNRLNGIGEFTASEITSLTKLFKLTKEERDEIFFTE